MTIKTKKILLSIERGGQRTLNIECSVNTLELQNGARKILHKEELKVQPHLHFSRINREKEDLFKEVSNIADLFEGLSNKLGGKTLPSNSCRVTIPYSQKNLELVEASIEMINSFHSLIIEGMEEEAFLVKEGFEKTLNA